MPDYQQEIEDILRKAEAEAPLPSPQSRRSLRTLVWQFARQSLNSNAWGVSPGKIMLAALGILLAAFLLRPLVPGMFGLLAWAGLIIFIVAYGMVFLKAIEGGPAQNVAEALPRRRGRRRRRFVVEGSEAALQAIVVRNHRRHTKGQA